MKSPAVNRTIKLLFATLALAGGAIADITPCPVTVIPVDALGRPLYGGGFVTQIVTFGEFPEFQVGPEMYQCRKASGGFLNGGSLSYDFIDPVTNSVSDYFDWAGDIMTLVSDQEVSLPPGPSNLPRRPAYFQPECGCFLPVPAVNEIGDETYNYFDFLYSGPPTTLFHIVSDVPEPGSWALLGTVLAGWAALRFRSARRSRC